MDSDRLNLQTSFLLDQHESSLFRDILVNNYASNEKMKEKKTWIQKTLTSIDPDLIVTFTSANFSYRCIRQLYPELTVLIIQTGLWISSERSSTWLGEARVKLSNLIAQVPARATTPGIYQAHTKNIYAVYSSSSAPQKAGSRYNVVVVGNLTLDEAFLPQYRKSTTKASKLTNGLYITQPIVHYFGVESHQKNLGLLKDILQSHSNLKLTIKCHPRDDINHYRELTQMFPDNIKWANPKMNLLQLINEHDILFGHFSAAMNLAAVVNMPAVCLDPELKYEGKLQSKSSFIKKVQRSSDLVLSNDFFTDSETRLEERKSYIEDVTGFDDGASFKRLINVVCEIMEVEKSVKV